MLRILHIADVHLDTPFNCRAETVRQRLRKALHESFVAAIDCAVQERVHAVLIAGDLVEAELVSFATARFVHTQVMRLAAAGIDVYYAAGNHDPGTAWLDNWGLDWPLNLHRIGNQLSQHFQLIGDSGEVEAALVAAGHRTTDEQTNLVASFPEADGKHPHIGLVHAQVASARSSATHGRYAQCTIDDLASKRYAYWALGHVHVRQQIAGTNAWYPGNILGRNPRETGPKGCHLVTIDRGLPVVEFREFAPLVWHELVLDNLAAITDDQQIVKTVTDLLDKIPESHDRIVKVVLSGTCPLASALKIDQRRFDIEQAIVDESDLLDVEIRAGGLTPPIDLSSLRDGRHVLGESLAIVENIRDNGPEAIQHFAPSPLATHHVEQADRARYLSSLAEDLEYELAERFTRR